MLKGLWVRGRKRRTRKWGETRDEPVMQHITFGQQGQAAHDFGEFCSASLGLHRPPYLPPFDQSLANMPQWEGKKQTIHRRSGQDRNLSPDDDDHDSLSTAQYQADLLGGVFFTVIGVMPRPAVNSEQPARPCRCCALRRGALAALQESVSSTHPSY
jgi:hypothetical protein